MSSQTDLDQGGTPRQWNRIYMGPSVGWVYQPGLNPLGVITVAGTYVLALETTLVQVNVAGLVTITLPTALIATVPAVAQPGFYARRPVTIVDVGGNAFNFPITIQPFQAIPQVETIMGLSSIQISTNYGAFTLNPSNEQQGWTSISP